MALPKVDERISRYVPFSFLFRPGRENETETDGKFEKAREGTWSGKEDQSPVHSRFLECSTA